jgi:NitT/TauT family transport system permease protein
MGGACRAELLSSTKGLGYMIQIGRVLAKPAIIITGMFVLGFSGAVMSGVLGILENRFSKWSRK